MTFWHFFRCGSTFATIQNANPLTMSKKTKDELIDELNEETLQEHKEQGESAIPDEESSADEEVDEVAQLRDELAKEKDKFLRLFAEFENFKRRTSKERIDLFKTAGQDIMVSMLPVLDDFDRGLKELSKNDDSELFKGVELIHNKFRDTLKNKGLEMVDVSEGDTFDADLHDAVTQIPAPNKKLKGKIIDVIEKGYKLGDRIIRHPKVVVGH